MASSPPSVSRSLRARRRPGCEVRRARRRHGRRSVSKKVPGHGWYARTWRWPAEPRAVRGSSRPSSRRSGLVSVMPLGSCARGSIVASQPAGQRRRSSSSAALAASRISSSGAVSCRPTAASLGDDRAAVEAGVHAASATRRSPRRRPGSRPGSASLPDGAAAATDGGSARRGAAGRAAPRARSGRSRPGPARSGSSAATSAIAACIAQSRRPQHGLALGPTRNRRIDDRADAAGACR